MYSTKSYAEHEVSVNGILKGNAKLKITFNIVGRTEYFIIAVTLHTQ